MRNTVLNMPKASQVLFNGSGCVTFHSSRETSGAAVATYRLWDGGSAAGTLLLPVELAASESTRDGFFQHVLPFKTGLYFELVAGTIEGAVGICFDHNCDHVLTLIVDALHAAG